MRRGVHANSRANLTRAGGDRTKGKKLVIAAIEKALREMPDGSEIRKFFGLHDGQLLKDKHRARWAKVKAPVVYDEMIVAMNEALLGKGFAGMLTKAEKAAINAEIEKLENCVEGGGGIPQAVLDEIEAELEQMRLDGYDQGEIDQWREWLMEDALLEAGDGVCLTPLEIAARRRALIREAKAGPKIYYEDMGRLHVGGFVHISPYVEKRLWPKTHQGGGSGSGGLVEKRWLGYAWLYYMGVQPGFGEFPTDLMQFADQNGESRYSNNGVVTWSKKLSSPAVFDEFALVVDHVALVRLAWMYGVRAYFETSGLVKDYSVNVFPGFVWAHIRETRERWAGGVRNVKVEVVKYLDSPEVYFFAAAWGLQMPVGIAGGAVGSWGSNHRSETSQYSVNSELGFDYSTKQISDKVKGWVFEFPELGEDSAAASSVIESAFPRRQKIYDASVGMGANNQQPVGLYQGGLRWYGWEDWGMTADFDNWIRQTHPGVDFDIPPLTCPPQKVKLMVKFAEEFKAAINEGLVDAAP